MLKTRTQINATLAFAATHRLSFQLVNGQERTEEVMLVDGYAFKDWEWNHDALPVWRVIRGAWCRHSNDPDHSSAKWVDVRPLA